MPSANYIAEQRERGLVFLAEEVRRKQSFPRAEVEAALEKYFVLASQAALTGDWNPWADQFTEDAIYIEHSYGILRGQESVRAWVTDVTGATPTDLEMVDEWHVIDNDLCVVYASNRHPAPDGGEPFQFNAVAILCYAGDGKWCYEEDIYNAVEAEQVMKTFAAAKGNAG